MTILDDITPEDSVVSVYLDPTLPPSPAPLLDNSEIAEQRRIAYTLESDPLFFKMQRGEDGYTMEEYLSKIEEIRERFPYPED